MTGVYYIPLGTPFLRTLAQGILAEFGKDPALMGQMVVLLPTRRGCLSLKEIFRQESGGKSFITPRIYALSDLEQTPVLPGFIPDIEESPCLNIMMKWERLGHLTRLVQHFLRKKNLSDSLSIAYPLAEELASFLDECSISGINLSQIDSLKGEEFPLYWQQNIDFLKIISDYWPLILQENKKKEQVQFQQDNLRVIAQQWRPSFPVILAGTTGTRPATADLARSLLKCPKGYIVLPGVDPDYTQDVPPTHPQYTVHQFIRGLGVLPSQISPWGGASPSSLIPSFLKQAMASPLKKSREWDEFSKTPLPVTLIPCTTEEEEALVIASLLRLVYEEDEKTAVLITPDRGLTRRVEAYLNRWDIIPNVSSGAPFSETVVGTFLSLITRIEDRMKITDWVALLKHPLFFKGVHRGDHLLATRQIEKDVFRQIRGVKPQDYHLIPDSLRPWYEGILDHVSPLFSKKRDHPFEKWLTIHKGIAFKLAGDSLWGGSDGQAAREFMDELEQEAIAFPAMSWGDYSSLICLFMRKISVHNKQGIGSPLKILGTLEARQIEADVIIMGGLNDSIWPHHLEEGPWVSSEMRLQLGLPPLQRRLGLSAHDFCLGFSGKDVYLTRSETKEGGGLLPSCLWLRVETILKESPLSSTKSQGILEMVRALDQSHQMESSPSPRPRPPCFLKPQQYSVTDIERMFRDPYGFYAQKILNLKKLGDLDPSLDPRDWGKALHRILEITFCQSHPKEGDNFIKTLKQIGQETLSLFKEESSSTPLFWQASFNHICDWFQGLKELDDIPFFHTEIKGNYPLSIGKNKITLTATADRIDQWEDGTCHIVDYKTGTPPTDKDIFLGFSPQMVLEGVILSHNGFPIKNVSSLGASYWVLKGEGSAIKPIKDYEQRMREAEEGIHRLLSFFHHKRAFYLSCPWGKKKVKCQDYHHLARVDEWMLFL